MRLLEYQSKYASSYAQLLVRIMIISSRKNLRRWVLNVHSLTTAFEMRGQVVDRHSDSTRLIRKRFTAAAAHFDTRDLPPCFGAGHEWCTDCWHQLGAISFRHTRLFIPPIRIHRRWEFLIYMACDLVLRRKALLLDGRRYALEVCRRYLFFTPS